MRSFSTSSACVSRCRSRCASEGWAAQAGVAAWWCVVRVLESDATHTCISIVQGGSSGVPASGAPASLAAAGGTTPAKGVDPTKGVDPMRAMSDSSGTAWSLASRCRAWLGVGSRLGLGLGLGLGLELGSAAGLGLGLALQCL